MTNSVPYSITQNEVNMHVSRWHHGSRDRNKDKPAERITPAVSHTLNCGLLVIFDDAGRKLEITLTHAEFLELTATMQTLVEDLTYVSII